MCECLGLGYERSRELGRKGNGERERERESWEERVINERKKYINEIIIKEIKMLGHMCFTC